MVSSTSPVASATVPRSESRIRESATTNRAILRKWKIFFFVNTPFILSFITPPHFSVRAVWYQKRVTVLQRLGVSVPHRHARISPAISIVRSLNHASVSGCSRRPCRYFKNSKVCFISLMSVERKANFKPILFFRLSFDTSPEDCVTK